MNPIWNADGITTTRSAWHIYDEDGVVFTSEDITEEVVKEIVRLHNKRVKR